jgi:enoyl-CoA hydratase/carnithine racemase
MNTFRFEQDGSLGKIILVETPVGQRGGNFADTLRLSIEQAKMSDIRVLLLSSESGNFAATNDPEDFEPRGLRWLQVLAADVNASIRNIEGLGVPSVASVSGTAIGGGFELLLACDFLIAADSAVLYLPEVKVGGVPLSGAVQRLAERVGRARASRLLMLPEPISGTEAAALGIATHVTPAGRLGQTAGELCRDLAIGPTLALVTIRSVLKSWSSGGVSGADVALPDLTAGLFGTEDYQAGMAAAAQAYKSGQPLPTLSFAGK